MIVGVVSFSDPLMLAGLLAAGIPVALHLLHQIRSPVVPFPTLRFLKITAQKTSRRRHVQHYLLLLLRMAVFAMIAMAVAHPLIRGGSSTLAYGFIAMLLGGMGLLVLAAAWGTTALDKHKSDAGVSVSKASDEKTRAVPESKAYWGLSTVAFVLALLMAGYAVFGLTSHTYFSGDKGEFSGHSTAAVLVLDDSHSMLAQEEGQTRLESAKRQVRSLLVETLHPAQAAILATNPGLTPTTESLTADMDSLIGALGSLQPTGRARPMKERIHAAVDLLMHSTLPSKMLIVLSDCAKPAFADAEVFSALKREGGGGKDIQVVIMPMGRGRAVEDVGIASLGVAEGSALAVVGGEVTLEAQVLNNGDAAVAKELELLVDGNIITPADTTALRVQLSAAGTGNARATLRLPYRLSDPGPHVFTLRVKDAPDAMAWDDERSLVLDVSPAVKVLVMGAEATATGPRARSAAFFFQAALAPFAGSSMKDAAGKPMPWPIEPMYRGPADIRGAGAFDGVGAVFLCDLPKISPALGDALATYAQRGGRVVWILGPSVNGPAYNQVLVPRGLLPAPLGEPLVSSGGATIDWVDLQSDIFANLFESQEPFRSVVVTGRWSVGTGGGGRALVKLADNSVVLTEHHGVGGGGAGGGDVYTLLTSPAAAWSNLGSTVLLVPMAARMALGDSGHSRFSTSYETGDSLFIPMRGVNARMAKSTLDVTLPNKEVLNLRAVTASSALPQWYFDRTQAEGVYRWRSTEGKQAGMFVVNPPGEEVDLSPADPNALAVEATTAGGGGEGGGHAAMVAHTAEELLGQLQKRGEGTTLAPGILGMVVILAVLEALLANRYRPSGSGVLERTQPAATSPLAA